MCEFHLEPQANLQVAADWGRSYRNDNNAAVDNNTNINLNHNQLSVWSMISCSCCCVVGNFKQALGNTAEATVALG